MSSPDSRCAACSGDSVDWFDLWDNVCTDHVDEHLRRFAGEALRKVIPVRQQHARLIPDVLKSWDAANDSGQGVFLFGPVRTGKSYTAAALLKRAWMQRAKRDHRHASARWVNVAEWFTDARRTIGVRKNPTDLTTVKDMIDCDLLVLDDLGAERQTAWVVETLYVVVNGRYDRMKPTIATSNLDLVGLAEGLTPTDNPDSVSGERIVRRLEDASCVVAMTKEVKG